MLTPVDVKFILIMHLYWEVLEIKGCSSCKYPPNSRFRLSSCILAFLAMFLNNSLP